MMENDQIARQIHVKNEQKLVSNVFKNLTMIYETFMQLKLRGSVLGFRYEEYNEKEYREFSFRVLENILHEIEMNQSDKQNIINMALTGIFNTQPKETVSHILIAFWNLFDRFNISKHRMVFYYCITAEMSSNNAKYWESILGYLCENLKSFENKEFRKLFFVIIEKSVVLVEDSSETEQLARNMKQFISRVIGRGMIPRILVLNQFCKYRASFEKGNKSLITSTLSHIITTFNPLKALITQYKRSFHLPALGISQLNDVIWSLEENSLLFKSPFLQNHFHSVCIDAPESNYLQLFLLKYCKFTCLLGLFDMLEGFRQAGANFSDVLKNVILYIFTYEKSKPFNDSEIASYKNPYFRFLYDLICNIALKNLLSVTDILKIIRNVVCESKLTITVKVVCLNLIYETVSMIRSMMTIDQMVDSIWLVNELIGNDLKTQEDCLLNIDLLISAACAWKQLQTVLTDEHAWINLKVPDSVIYILDVCNHDFNHLHPDAVFHPNFISRINMLSTRSNIPNKYFDMICSLYDGSKGIQVYMPRGYFTRINPNFDVLDFNIFKKIRNYPITQLLIFVVRKIDEKSMHDPNWVLPPLWLDIIYYHTLGENANFYILYHNIGSLIKKFINRRIHNSLNLILEDFTHRPLAWEFVNTAIFIFIHMLNVQQLSVGHRELHSYLYTFLLSFFIRFPRFDQSFNIYFYNRISREKPPIYFPDIAVLFVWNMIHSLHLMGFRQNIDPLLVEYVEKLIKQFPHTWNSALLSKCPSDISKLYEDVVDFDPNEFIVQLTSLKASLAVKLEENLRFMQLFQNQTSYQHIILCVILDRLMGEKMEDNFVFIAYRKISILNVSYAIRKMIFYIIVQNIDINSDKMYRVTQVIDEMIWDLQLFSLDQFLFSLLTFYYNDSGNQIIFFLINFIFRSFNFQKALYDWKEIKPKSSKLISKIEASHNFYKSFNEIFDFSILNKKLNLSEDPNRPSPEPLAIFYNNTVNRLGFYVDMVLYRTLEMQDAKKQFIPLLKNLKNLFDTHPCPIRSTVTIIIDHYDFFDANHREKYKLVKKYIKNKYTQEQLINKFSSIFMQNYLTYTTNICNHITLLSFLITRIACCLSLNAFQCFEKYSETLEEFNGNHLNQFLICCSFEIVIFTSPKSFAESFLDIYLDTRYSLLSSAESIDPEFFIQSFGMILAVLPKIFFLEVIKHSIKYILKINDHITVNTPKFLDFECTATSNEVYSNETTLLLFLLRSFFENVPIGYLSDLPSFIGSQFNIASTSEARFLFVITAVFPCLKRLDKQPNSSKIVKNIGVIFGSMLRQIVMKKVNLQFPMLVSDFFYLLKYAYVGENINEIIAYFINELNPSNAEFFKLL